MRLRTVQLRPLRRGLRRQLRRVWQLTAAKAPSGTYYRVTPGIDIAPGEGALLVRSDTLSCRIEGVSAAEVIETLWPLLARWTSASDLARSLPAYRPEDVSDLLEAWSAAGLLRSRRERPSAHPPSAALSALVALGLDEGDVGDRLGQARLAVFGAGPLAQAVARALSDAGFLAVSHIGSGVARGPGGDSLSRERVEALAGGCDLMVSAVDRGHLASRHWVNRAAIACGRPALFAELELSSAFVGPLVLPGESPCYMCYRMRRMAMSDSFTDAFAYEQRLDTLRREDLTRPVLPGLVEAAAGMVVGEAIKLLFGPLTPSLTSAVVELEGLGLELRRHEVLPRADCPHCGGVLSAVRTGEA